MSLRVYSTQKYTTRSFNNGTDPTQDPANSAVFILKSAASNTFTDVGPNAYTVSNNASVTNSTSTAKFVGTSSASFNGSNYLSVDDAAPLRPGTGSFTWEFWWYPTDLSSYKTPLGKGYTGAGDIVLQCGPNSGNIYAYINQAVVTTATVAVTANTWNHVAVVRNGTSVTIYINGSSAGTGTSSANINNTNPLAIGAPYEGGSYGSIGFIQDVRLSSIALYTANFTPPGSLS